MYPLILGSGLPLSVLTLELIEQLFRVGDTLGARCMVPTAVDTLAPAAGQARELNVSVLTVVSVR